MKCRHFVSWKELYKDNKWDDKGICLLNPITDNQKTVTFTIVNVNEECKGCPYFEGREE